MKQAEFEFKSWGGAREGAGRKRRNERRCVARTPRPTLKTRHPTHVTLRLAAGLNSLRCDAEFAATRDALVAGSDQLGLRIVQFSVLSNHVHLVCEADDERALARGLKGLCVRIARALNRLWKRVGPVFADRYHSRTLESPREAHAALKYVLHNAARHGVWLAGPDPCSSGAWFDGWRHALRRDGIVPASPLPRARTWLLREGWRHHGLLDPVPPPFAVRDADD